MPMVLADETDVVVAYLLPDETDWNRPPQEDHRVGEPSAVVRFKLAKASMLGPPNDEAFDGHPLARRGLEPYGAFEVLKSSWIRGLEKMNRVHPHHSREMFSDLRHFVLAFHDTTFECVAERYEFRLARGSVNDLIAEETRRWGNHPVASFD